MGGFVRAGLLAAVLWSLAGAGVAAGRADRDGVLDYLRTALGPPDRCSELAGPTKVDIAWADLNGDGRPEALVYVSGRGWCGSGGCQLMVLEPTAAGFRERGNISISRQPIAALPLRSHGWREISVFVAGGGILPGYSAALPFDGDRYASNPSVPPARPLDPKVKVRNVFAGPVAETGLRLFPASTEPRPPADLPEGVVTVTDRRVEVSVPDAFADCWTWLHISSSSVPGPLRYSTGTMRRDAAGRMWQVWVYEASGSGEATLDFALVPNWKFFYPTETARPAAAKIWTAKVVIP